MNEQDLKEMIRSLLSEMDTDTVTELKKEEQKQDSEFKSLEKNGVQPDKEETTTETVLRFRADHAAAQDAVFSNVSDDFVKEMGFIPVQTKASTKDEYLTRPDYGRVFPEDQQKIIKESCKPNPKVQIVVGDGLSSSAIEANVRDFLPALKQGLKMFGLDFNEVLFIKHARVAAMDQIAELTGAEVICMLVGERPGLVTAESMSAYMAYKPTVGMPESRRTVVSNIHKGGTPAVEAGAYVAEIIKKILDNKKSGVELK